MSIVGIDPSLTATGIAILDRDFFDAATVTKLTAVGRKGRETDRHPERSDRIVAQTRRIVAHVPPDAALVLIEDIPEGINRLPSYRDRCVLWGGVYSTLRGRGLPIVVINPTTRAVWATGKGTKKPDVLAAVRLMWPAVHIADDNEGDALILASIGAHHLGWTMPFETKPRHTTGLDKVEWPEGVA
ncbi:hypothetical protein [Gordonia sp. OPL2]|uniref:hypothetical protein n=1 Tax=Gordonia sp. OPL2 TaxID=2486274 RepID=UPI00165502A9|nr:hypothetical protein [Gordonia sp. OPL2]ROZ88995.1 hypothetical protein EEB19_20000 [Gordonia sp. OPL2]